MNSGPPILATFEVESNLIKRITLSPASTFTCKMADLSLKEEILAWMKGYLEGKKPPLLPLDFSSFTPFIQKGLKAIQRIPFGKVSTYGELAEEIGHSKAARALGNICNRNPYPLVIPCHRVIGKNGKLVGFAYGLKMKQDMLQYEKLSNSSSTAESSSSSLLS